ncbi:MAG: EF-Tu/IF-2/RF-3 family GTPase, partial [Sphingomonas sp.]
LRSVPIITFVNKVDREGRQIFETLDEIADMLALDVVPMTWPVGMGGEFEGIYDLVDNRLLLPEGGSREFQGKVEQMTGLDDPRLDTFLSAQAVARLREEIELAGVGYPEFDAEAYRNGDLTPVYFGSALKEFGVDSLIDAIAKHAPPPHALPAEPAPVSPDTPQVTGFIFKVQANMDPNHRDRIAFMRLVSGTFKRGMKLTPTGHGKPIAIHSPILFFARERELADEAFPGDIIGIPNHGVLRVGDTLSEKADVRFTGLPNFAPEILRRVVLKDPTKTKQLRKALDDMAEEGVTQVFYPDIGSNWVIGVVGQLQLDVLLSRLDAEYKVAAGLEMAPFETARWVSSENPADLKSFEELNRGGMAKDRDGNPVFMAKSAWEVNYLAERYDKVKFAATRER